MNGLIVQILSDADERALTSHQIDHRLLGKDLRQHQRIGLMGTVIDIKRHPIAAKFM